MSFTGHMYKVPYQIDSFKLLLHQTNKDSFNAIGFLLLLFNNSDGLDMKSVPFFVEKVLEFILQCISLHLKRLRAEEEQLCALNDARKATDLVFDSMRLLKSAPNFIMEHVALRIARRVCEVLRCIYCSLIVFTRPSTANFCIILL